MEVKGVSLAATREFVKREFGDDGFKKWLAAMPQDSRHIFENAILSPQWYPVEAAFRLPTKIICELFFAGDKKGAWALGRFAADYSLNGVYKLFIRFGSPMFIVKKAGTVIENFYKPSAVQIADEQAKSVKLRITKFEGLDEYAEQRIGGWMERALELSAGKNSSLEISQSYAKGAPYAEFHAKWE